LSWPIVPRFVLVDFAVVVQLAVFQCPVCNRQRRSQHS
jgi:hypothetical protein